MECKFVEDKGMVIGIIIDKTLLGRVSAEAKVSPCLRRKD